MPEKLVSILNYSAISQMLKKGPQSHIGGVANRKWDSAAGCMKQAGVKCECMLHVCSKSDSVLRKKTSHGC